VSNRYFTYAAILALGASTPALATAAPTPARPAGAQPAAAAQAPPTRAVLVKNMDANFKAIDTNGDGALSQSELAAAEAKGEQQRQGQLRTRMEGEFTKLDTNKDGQLSKAEFLAATPPASNGTPNGANILSQLDKNKDGKVTPDEYRAPVLSRFDALDTNHDGTLSATERQAAQAAKPAKKR
jgi:Ca2+-binding EF-hand superfamily protein